MQFQLSKAKAKLTAFNPRGEFHGEERMPAADLILQTDISNNELAMFHPTLKSSLYHFDDQIGGDLVDAAQKDGDPNYAPHLRFAHLAVPIKWDDAVIGAKVTVHHGVHSKSDIVIDTCRVDGFKIEPKQGGTVTITFKVSGHPDEKAAGKLCTMVQQDLEITLDPPKADEQGDLPGTEK